MRLRNHLLEAGPQRQMADRSQCQQYGHHRTEQQKRPATVEDKPFKQAAGRMIEVTRIAHDRHQIAGANIAIHGALPVAVASNGAVRSEEHTSELQSLMRLSYAGFCL